MASQPSLYGVHYKRETDYHLCTSFIAPTTCTYEGMETWALVCFFGAGMACMT